MKTTVIHHSADYDGIFCREIARKFLPGAEFIGWDYGDPLINFPNEGTIYILDLSPDCLAQLWSQDYQRVIWIDHHKSAIDKWSNTLPGYRIDGVAACRLAWQWFQMHEHWDVREIHPPYDLPSKQQYIDRNVLEPLAVRLAGEYDIWDKRDPRAETFQFGLRSRDLTNDWAIILSNDRRASVDEVSALIDVGHQGMLKPDGTIHNPLVVGLLTDGAALQRYQREQDASVVKRGFDVEFEGKKFLALNVARCNSLTFESAALPHHDGLMGFYWTGKEWSVSLYHSPHHKEHDLSAIAVKYGGGGHRGACGFRTSKLPFIP